MMHFLVMCQILNKNLQIGRNLNIATEKLPKTKCQLEYANLTFQVKKRFVIRMDGSVTFKLQLTFQSEYVRN